MYSNIEIRFNCFTTQSGVTVFDKKVYKQIHSIDKESSSIHPKLLGHVLN